MLIKKEIHFIRKCYFLIVFFNILLSCSNDSNQREIITLLDIIPFGDRIHFSIFIRKSLELAEIVKLYGEPNYILHFDSTGNLKIRNNIIHSDERITDKVNIENYTVQIHGYDSSPYKISNKVYIYLGGFDAIAYIYVDSCERIEHVFIGGS
jgi:hypothetical protein